MRSSRLRWPVWPQDVQRLALVEAAGADVGAVELVVPAVRVAGVRVAALPRLRLLPVLRLLQAVQEREALSPLPRVAEVVDALAALPAVLRAADVVEGAVVQRSRRAA